MGILPSDKVEDTKKRANIWVNSKIGEIGI